MLYMYTYKIFKSEIKLINLFPPCNYKRMKNQSSHCEIQYIMNKILFYSSITDP